MGEMSRRERVMAIVLALLAGFAVVQFVWWVGRGDADLTPPVGGVPALLLWMQFTSARSARLRRNPSRAENRIQVGLAGLVAVTGVLVLIDGPSPMYLLVGILQLVVAAAAVIGVLLRGTPSEPDAVPRRAASPPDDPRASPDRAAPS